MSPYRYVGSKDELIVLMADAVYGESRYPQFGPQGWRARLELGARTLWALFRRHPWLALLNPLTRPVASPSLIVHAEWALSALDGLGLDPHGMRNLLVVSYGYVQGIATSIEHEAEAEAASGLSDEQWNRAQAPALGNIARSGRHPTFARVNRGLARNRDSLDLDEVFNLGLQVLLDGIEARVGRSAGG
jgi:hypothetical protein